MVHEIQKSNLSIDEIETMLPQMASMFLDELAVHHDPENLTPQNNIAFKSDLHQRVRYLRFPDANRPGIEKANLRRGVTRSKKRSGPAYRREDQFTLLRESVLNLSHAYNNILMGISGYLTLINMEAAPSSDTQDRCQQIEHLIQTGGNLINLIFGYLVERRLTARRLQLVQLFGEFDLCSKPEYYGIDVDEFKKNMRRIAAFHHQSKIFAAVARVMKQLLSWIKDQILSLHALNSADDQLHSRLKVTDDLLDRGFKMVQDLRYHAGDIAPVIRRMSLRALIEKHIRRFKTNTPRINLWLDFPSRWPWIHADRRQIDYAIQQVIDNAVQAMPGKGSLSIRVRTLDEEIPSQRCAVHSGGDYIVITISDSGQGMDIHTQGRIFQPFCKVNAVSLNRLGLGLSAASGILKCHGGYIQVRSAPGSGTRVMIYLPIGKIV